MTNKFREALINLGFFMTFIPLVVFAVVTLYFSGVEVWTLLTSDFNLPKWIAGSILGMVVSFMVGMVITLSGIKLRSCDDQ